MFFSALLLASSAVASARAAYPTGGTTNPPAPTMLTTINQKSMVRLLSINSIDNFCLFAPPTGPSNIADTETEEVAWCTLPRNNTRVIRDGVITGVSFTKLTVAAGNAGGELDPHGAEGTGNPVGGNWMLYMSADQFCLRACYNANATYSAAAMCGHKLDLHGHASSFRLKAKNASDATVMANYALQ
ncbi:immunoreactive manno protein MP88 [Mycena olivaceomarginata]|nr:immunoreactive manno protein MP88 [Mycena olivaceomarginata]